MRQQESGGHGVAAPSDCTPGAHWPTSLASVNRSLHALLNAVREHRYTTTARFWRIWPWCSPGWGELCGHRTLARPTRDVRFGPLDGHTHPAQVRRELLAALAKERHSLDDVGPEAP